MEPIAPPQGTSVEVSQPTRRESAVAEQAPASHSPERPASQEIAQHVGARGAAADPAQVTQQLPTPVHDTPQASSSAPADDNPLIASDDDVMEKEWVDKAKSVVAQTKDDPFNQEKAVSKLQADYLKKRYGKEIKLSVDE